MADWIWVPPRDSSCFSPDYEGRCVYCGAAVDASWSRRNHSDGSCRRFGVIEQCAKNVPKQAKLELM